MLPFDEWVGGSYVNEGRTGWELVVFSMEDDVLKASVTGVKNLMAAQSEGLYSSPCVAGINLEHGQQGYLLSLWQQPEGGADDWQ